MPRLGSSRPRLGMAAGACQKFATRWQKGCSVLVNPCSAEVVALDDAAEAVAEIRRHLGLDLRVRVEDRQIGIVAGVNRAFALEARDPGRRLSHPPRELVE